LGLPQRNSLRAAGTRTLTERFPQPAPSLIRTRSRTTTQEGVGPVGLPAAIGSRRPLLLAVAILLVAAIGIGLAFASGLVRPGPVGSSVAEASGSPTATASPPFPPLAGALPPGSLATVLTDVVMREHPSTEARQVTIVHGGQTLYIQGPTGAMQFGPVFADGATWYPASFARDFDAWPADVDRLNGWVAVEQSGASRVEPRAVVCPDEVPTPGLLVTMTSWARVACYGERDLVLERTWSFGFLVDEFGMVPWEGVPAWLARRPEAAIAVGLFEVGAAAQLDMALLPDAQVIAVNGQIARVTGHFDDPASTNCVISTGDPLVEQPRETVQLWCREQFVVTKVELAGAPAP
jgi:hypothetical protein